jgi:hypothetical protein
LRKLVVVGGGSILGLSSAIGLALSSPGAIGYAQPACGPGAVSLVAATALQGGGERLTYSANGTQWFSVMPPVGFRPLTASAAQLAEYNFPARPSRPGLALTQWDSDMASYRSTPLPHYSVGCTPISQPVGQASGGSPFTFYYPKTWSGYEADSSSSTNYVAVQGNFSQPAKQASCLNAGEATWVGLGGGHGGDGEIIQGGTAIYGPGASTEYEVWFEDVGTQNIGPVYDSSIALSPGNAIHVYVSYEQSNGIATIYIADNSTGQADNQGTGALTSGDYNGATAEWIAEWPGGKSGGLIPFGQVSWSNAQTENSAGTWESVGAVWNSGQGGSDTMYYNGTELAHPSYPPNGYTFTDYWDNCI